jgi:glycosyltransferase involved in cell wall biosynthesis
MRENNKLKIAMIGQKTMPAIDSSRGGVEVVVEELAPRMVAKGAEVTCFNRSGCDNGGLSNFKGVRLVNVPTIKRKGLAAASSSFFASVKAAFGRFDIIHFHAEGPCAMMWIPKLFGKKCVCTIHGLDHQRAEKWSKFARWYIRHGERVAVKRADAIIVLTEAAKEYFWKEYRRETVLIPNGVNKQSTDIGDDLIAQKFGIHKNEYILFLGRLVPEKGIQYLVDAYLRLKTDKKLVIAGAASDTDEFVQELNKKTAGNEKIIYTGFINGKPKEQLYANAYVYVLPSDLEGMPLTLLEAMSFGNCCVVSSIKECTEVVDDKAVVFKQGDAEDLREKLQGLCDKPGEVEKMQAESTDFICNKYSWDDVVDRTLNLYNIALGKN